MPKKILDTFYTLCEPFSLRVFNDIDLILKSSKAGYFSIAFLKIMSSLEKLTWLTKVTGSNLQSKRNKCVLCKMIRCK